MLPLCSADTMRPAAGPRACLEALPEELKLHILKQTGPNPYTVLSMQQVNRSWSRIAQDNSLWAPLCPTEVTEASMALQPAPSTPQHCVGVYLRAQRRGLRQALHQLWHNSSPLIALTHASCEPIFVCHALLALPDPTEVPWRWSPLHTAGQAPLRALYSLAWAA